MHQSYQFPTFSSYEGSWNNATSTMNGFGIYTFPDGSAYQGYFYDGRFHGFGTMKISKPQKCIIKGSFHHGKCVEIQEFYFGDGLEFVGKFQKDGTLNAKNWDYCDGTHDRLYFNEGRMGLEPPGPHAFLTAQRKARIIPKGTYDTGDGIFNPNTGFIVLTEKTGEKSKLRFVSCASDRNYIQQNYRISKGADDCVQPIEPRPEILKEIMSCNLRAMCHRHEAAVCICKTKMERDRYYSYLCPIHACLKTKKKDVAAEGEEEKEEDDQKKEISPRCDIDLTPSSSSIESFDELSDSCKEDILVPSDLSIETEDKPHFNPWHKKEAMAKITRFSIVLPSNKKY